MEITVGHHGTAPGIAVGAAPPLGRRTLAVVGLLVASVALPFIFLPMQASWAHLGFHVIGVPLCVLAVLVLRGLRRASVSRTLRVMTWVSSAGYLGWGIGHLGELFVVLTHGGVHAEAHLFEHPVHVFFANIAVPSWMFTMASLVVLLVTVGVQSIIRRARRTPAG